jgi:hypothetical protein
MSPLFSSQDTRVSSKSAPLFLLRTHSVTSETAQTRPFTKENISTSYKPSYTRRNISKYSFLNAILPFISVKPFSLNDKTTFRIFIASLMSSWSPPRRSWFTLSLKSRRRGLDERKRARWVERTSLRAMNW